MCPILSDSRIYIVKQWSMFCPLPVIIQKIHWGRALQPIWPIFNIHQRTWTYNVSAKFDMSFLCDQKNGNNGQTGRYI